jgi:rubrerythrin
MSTTNLAPRVGPTIENLLAAYQGELNARARYLAFADRADEDGFSGIASLFRAAARAEQIHAHNQARVLRQLGAEARAELIACRVHDTLENLKIALSGEKYEIEAMYPAFIDEARAAINSNAARCFEWSLEAEKGHARLCAEALDLFQTNQMESWIRSARDFFVCPVCACTSEHKTDDNCGICQYPADRLETIR